LLVLSVIIAVVVTKEAVDMSGDTITLSSTSKTGTIFVNNIKVNAKDTIIISDSTMYVPLIAVLEALGSKIVYNSYNTLKNNFENSKKEGVISVSEITNAIKLLLENSIGLVSVEGEISNYKPHYSRHRYFTLKDDKAQISCTMWKSRNVNFEMADGQKVVATGTISVYPPRGNYQLDVISLVPAGVGDLYKAFELLKQKLQNAGYFDIARKKIIPEMPMNIGVSTSPTGAAVEDIFSTIKRRFSSANIYFRPTIVQGDSAAPDIVNAINELQKTPAEVIIIGRGGGSIEDLWAYNTELVANAIYNSTVPIISAVGHETDFTIADFVADCRAATPTAAAELTTPQTSFDIINRCLSYQNLLNKTIASTVENYYNLIDDFSEKRTGKQILDKIYYHYQLLDSKEEAIRKELNYKLQNNWTLLASLENQCRALSPTAPLSRGFALLKHKNNFIKNDESLSQYDKFEIIRDKENVVAKFVRLVENDLFE
jgi:exodeoxyribonuclease VII large subunit